MAGNLCFGTAYNNCGAGTLRESKAFAEGIMHRASGTGLERPVTDNPHEAGSEASFTWDLGWLNANDAAGTALPAIGCCAPTGVILA